VSIDVAFDFRSDAGGRDPDQYSPTLRRYHKQLWSKPLPSGESFDLSDATPGIYLHHRSALGDFQLASDSVMQTFTRWKRLKPITTRLADEENEAFQTITYTIGGMVLFPGNKIDGKITINGARGFNRAIADRFDLTLECIRRHYLDEHSPLADTLTRYHDFFALFTDFRGYTEFFLLQDLLRGDRVRFFTPFDDFRTSPVPQDLDTYTEFRRHSIEFVHARNERIALSTLPG
jgi:hypothetical protein